MNSTTKLDVVVVADKSGVRPMEAWSKARWSKIETSKSGVLKNSALGEDELSGVLLVWFSPMTACGFCHHLRQISDSTCREQSKMPLDRSEIADYPIWRRWRGQCIDTYPASCFHRDGQRCTMETNVCCGWGNSQNSLLGHGGMLSISSLMYISHD